MGSGLKSLGLTFVPVDLHGKGGLLDQMREGKAGFSKEVDYVCLFKENVFISRIGIIAEPHDFPSNQKGGSFVYVDDVKGKLIVPLENLTALYQIYRNVGL